MIDNLPTISRLLRQLQQVPYLASKNIYRVMQYVLEMDDNRMTQMCQAVKDAREKIVKCERCWTWRERAAGCPFCDDPKRDHTIICVVETWHDLYAIEKSAAYKSEYHVLGGSLNPLEGVGADQLKIKELAERCTDRYTEVILALNQTPEGEATAAFIVRALQGKAVVVSSLARGIAVGASLEFTDRLTLHKAISERRVL